MGSEAQKGMSSFSNKTSPCRETQLTKTATFIPLTSSSISRIQFRQKKIRSIERFFQKSDYSSPSPAPSEKDRDKSVSSSCQVNSPHKWKRHQWMGEECSSNQRSYSPKERQRRGEPGWFHLFFLNEESYSYYTLDREFFQYPGYGLVTWSRKADQCSVLCASAVNCSAIQTKPKTQGRRLGWVWVGGLDI